VAEKIYLRGKINWDGYLNSDADSCLAIQTDDENLIFAEFFEENLLGKNVSVNYYISDKKLSREELEKQHLEKIFGVVDAECYPVYSDVTGYLWTEEKCRIGGHDLFEELFNYEGKYIDMEISIDERSEK
jgi:hypothetical protein